MLRDGHNHTRCRLPRRKSDWFWQTRKQRRSAEVQKVSKAPASIKTKKQSYPNDFLTSLAFFTSRNVFQHAGKMFGDLLRLPVGNILPLPQPGQERNLCHAFAAQPVPH